MGKILLVDDYSLIQAAVAKFLTANGYNVEKFTDPRDALLFFQDHSLYLGPCLL